MKIDPENILLRGNNLHFKKKIFLISGNEETLIKKIQDTLVQKIKDEGFDEIKKKM